MHTLSYSLLFRGNTLLGFEMTTAAQIWMHTESFSLLSRGNMLLGFKLATAEWLFG
jgi:hypothetical protein